MHNNKINNLILKYIEDNNINIILYKQCIYIHDTTLKDLKKIFYNNLDIRKLYNTNYLCLYQNDYMRIFDDNLTIGVRRKLNVDNGFDKSINMNFTSFKIAFEWKLENKLLNHIHEDIYDFFMKYIAPKLTSIQMGSQTPILEVGITWVDYIYTPIVDE